MTTKYLDELLNSFLALGYPMAELNVWRDHKEIYRGSFGWADREAQIAPTPDTLYFFYSCTKPITCAAALTLLEQGKLLLTDELARFFPEYASMQVAEKKEDGTVTLRPAARRITVRDLFTMTAGFSYNLGSPAIKAVTAEKNGAASTQDVIRALAKEPLLFDPGAKWNYSLCHDVLAGVVEAVAGERFCDYVRRVIFEPLEMADSSFHAPADLTRMAQQYRFNTDFSAAELFGKRNAYILSPEYDSGGAGLVSTPADYMKFADAMAMGGKGGNGARILKEATVRLMRTDALTDAQRNCYVTGNKNRIGFSYGLGVRTLLDPAAAGTLTLPGEFGWNGAAGMRAMFEPNTGISMLFTQHTLNPNKVDTLALCRNAVMGALDE